MPLPAERMRPDSGDATEGTVRALIDTIDLMRSGQSLRAATVLQPFTTVLDTAALLAAGGSVVSAWADASTFGDLFIRRTATGGAFAFEVDWSTDGVTTDITETVAVGNNTSVVKRLVAKFFRVRVRNTDAVTAFSAHRTVVTTR